MKYVGKVPVNASATTDDRFEGNEVQEPLLTHREMDEERLLLWQLVLSCEHCRRKMERL